MKSISCREVRGLDCDYIVKGETTEEVKKDTFTHAEQVHKDILQKMTPDDLRKLTERMNSLIK